MAKVAVFADGSEIKADRLVGMGESIVLWIGKTTVHLTDDDAQRVIEALERVMEKTNATAATVA